MTGNRQSNTKDNDNDNPSILKMFIISRLHELYIASRSLVEPVGLEDDLSFNRYSSEPSLIRFQEKHIKFNPNINVLVL